MSELLLKALIAGGVIAIAAAPLGCLVVWRRMAYFGDATSHAGLLGIVLGTALGINLSLGVALLAALMAIAVTVATRRGRYAVDTILGVFAHSALAIGLVAAALVPGVRLDVEQTLIGDILFLTWDEIIFMAVGGAVILLVILWRWRDLLNATLHPDLMVAEGGKIILDRLFLTLTLALFVALAMKLIGVLLITAMLILPAAAARPVARSPEAMVGLSMMIGLMSVVAGIWFSWTTDAPAGPSIVVISALCFVLSNLGSRLRA